MVSEWYQNGIRMVSEWYQNGIKMVSEWYQEWWSEWYQNSIKMVSGMVSEWYQNAIRMLSEWYQEWYQNRFLCSFGESFSATPGKGYRQRSRGPRHWEEPESLFSAR